jgi:hypothetical protein
MRHYLSVCACLKNEADYLLEWLCFHTIVGVERFVIYDNESTDDTAAIVAEFNRAFPGSVELIPWPGQPGQATAFSDAITRLKGHSEWVAFLDGDEFLFGTEEDDLRTLLREYEDASELCIHWLIFGSSGYKTKPPGLCIDRFTRRAINHADHKQVKSIVRVNRVVKPTSPHLFQVRGAIVDELRRKVDPKCRGRLPTATHKLFRINHYITKSHEQFMAKGRRGRPVPDSDPTKHRALNRFHLYDFNEIEDLTIARFSVRVRAMMAEVASAHVEGMLAYG